MNSHGIRLVIWTSWFLTPAVSLSTTSVIWY